MRIVAFVPIKTNNERLPGKNTKAFTNGKPLLCYILETLCQVKQLDEIYVYCSDEMIKGYLPNKVKFLKRDPYLDLSTTSFNEVLKTFAQRVDADAYLLTHATAPFIKVESFEKAIAAMNTEKYDSALTVTKMQEFIWKDGKPFNYDPRKIPRTQDLSPLYVETCGMYLFTRKLILEDNRRIGYKPFFVEVDKIEAVDINDKEDFVLADALYDMRKGK